jgi:cytochrome P450
MTASSTAAPAEDWDPFGPENVADPVATHNHMRRTCPVAYSNQFGGFWALFKRDDIMTASRDPETFSSAPAISIPAFSIEDAPWLPLQSDPPVHRQIRRIITPSFAASRLESFKDDLEKRANVCIDNFIGRGEADLVKEFTLPFTASGMCFLLGLPEESAEQLHKWTVDILEAGRRGDVDGVMANYGEMYKYADKWMDARLDQPTDDLMTAMVTCKVEEKSLTRGQIRGMFALLVMAGHETTADTMCNALYLLATNREVRDAFHQRQPFDHNLVNEIFRYCNPTQAMARTTTREVEIRGRTIPAGSRVALMFGGGCRDEEAFEDPDTFNPDRTDNAHVAFGWGHHRCLGEPFAKIEVKIGIQAILKRIPEFELAATPTRMPWVNIGYLDLPIRFKPATPRESAPK